MLGVGGLDGGIVDGRCDGWMGGLGDWSGNYGVVGDAGGGLINTDDLWEGNRACWGGMACWRRLVVDEMLRIDVVLSSNVVLSMEVEKAFDVSGLLFCKRDETVQFAIGGFSNFRAC